MEKFSILELINYFFVCGDSKQKNAPSSPPQKKEYFDHKGGGVGGSSHLWCAPPKTTSFFDVAPYLERKKNPKTKILESWRNERKVLLAFADAQHLSHLTRISNM